MKTDAEIVASYLSGNEAAFEELLARHLPAVYSFALRFTGDAGHAEDIAQDTFFKAWRALPHFAPEKAGFRTWLMRIARNTAIDRMRRARQIPFSAFERDGENPMDTVPSDDDLVAVLEELSDLRTIEKTIARLDAPAREVVLLYLQSDTLEDVAAILDEPLNTVKSRYRRAIQKIRTLLHPNRGEGRI